MLPVALLPVLAAVGWPSQQAVQGAGIRQEVEPVVRYVAAPFTLPASLRDSVRFGWLDVPQDHDDPGAGTLRLAMSVLPARASMPEPDPVVFIPGGPGMAAVEPWTVEAARSARIALLRERRDFIILDPRGHGLSQPRTCPELDGAEPLVDDSPAAEAILAGKLRACRAELEASGVRPATLDAVQAAHDIELLRRALGVRQVNLFGGSYGTRIAAEVVRRHPASIRSVVFLSPVPPDIPHLGDQDSTASEVLGTLLRRCAALRDCHSAFPDLASDYDSVMARARRAPREVPLAASDRLPEGRLRLDDRMLKHALAELLVARSLAAGAPMMIHTLANDGVGALLPMAPQLLRMLSDDDVRFGTNLAFHCNDSPASVETARWLRTRCPAWVGDDYGSDDHAVHADVPALIMAGEFDPRTPPSYARHLATGLTNAHLLIVPWHGHDLQHPCLSRIQRDFFDRPAAAPRTACLDSLPAFRVAGPVTPSRWVAGATLRLANEPFYLVAAAVPLALLLGSTVGLVWDGRRRRRTGDDRRGRLEHALLGLASAVGLTLVIATGIAVWVGGTHSPLVPAIGVPRPWSWVLLLPGLLLVLVVAIVATSGRSGRSGRRPATPIRAATVAGAILLLAYWALLSNGGA